MVLMTIKSQIIDSFEHYRFRCGNSLIEPCELVREGHAFGVVANEIHSRDHSLSYLNLMIASSSTHSIWEAKYSSYCENNCDRLQRLFIFCFGLQMVRVWVQVSAPEIKYGHHPLTPIFLVHLHPQKPTC